MSKSPGKNTTKPLSPEPARASNADYPVEPEERVSQQERLRKAAAAGANALKSPVRSGMFGLPAGSGATAQKPLAPTAAVTQSESPAEAAPEADQPLSVEMPADPKLALQEMQERGELLAELKKISRWAEMQRKTMKWSFIVLAVFIPATIGVVIMMERQVNTNLDATLPPAKPDWYDVERSVRVGDFDKAIAAGEELILKTPQYPEAHKRLAGAYLATGKLDKAREHYAEAFRLFPSEENEKLLAAIDNRIKSDKP